MQVSAGEFHDHRDGDLWNHYNTLCEEWVGRLRQCHRGEVPISSFKNTRSKRRGRTLTVHLTPKNLDFVDAYFEIQFSDGLGERDQDIKGVRTAG